MAREDVRGLYRSLVEVTFRFVPRGERHVEEVYFHVRKRYPRLCDDRFLCAENCTSGHEQAEWKHAVRKALNRVRRTSTTVSRGAERGFWLFR